MHVARWGGGYYEEIGPSETSVAYYQSSKDIAILRSRTNVVLSCVHPELQLHIPYVREHLPIEDAETEKLLPDSRRQQKLLADLLKILNVEAAVPQEEPDCDDSKPAEEASPVANASEEAKETNSTWASRFSYIHPSNYSSLHLLIKNIATEAIRVQVAQWLKFMHPNKIWILESF